MKRAMKTRKDLDDDPPEWVTQPERKVPRCIKCRAEVPSAKSLHTICGRCLGVQSQVRLHDVRALIREVIAKLGEDSTEQLVKIYGQAAGDERVRYHAERLMARGLYGSMAYRQAQSLVEDPAHREICGACAPCDKKGDPGIQLQRG